MFTVVLYIFAVWGVICTVYLALYRLLLSSVQAEILYKLDEEKCDGYSALCCLSECRLPVVVITESETDEVIMLKKDFPQAKFLSRAELTEHINKE